MTYAQKLKLPQWRQRRCERIEKAEHCCSACGGHESIVGALQVHHVIYLRGREPWEYSDELLLVLCESCHFDRQINDEEASFEFAWLRAQMSNAQVYELAKGLRLAIDGGYAPKYFDAHEALTRFAQGGRR